MGQPLTTPWPQKKPRKVCDPEARGSPDPANLPHSTMTGAEISLTKVTDIIGMGLKPWSSPKKCQTNSPGHTSKCQLCPHLQSSQLYQQAYPCLRGFVLCYGEPFAQVEVGLITYRA